MVTLVVDVCKLARHVLKLIRLKKLGVRKGKSGRIAVIVKISKQIRHRIW